MNKKMTFGGALAAATLLLPGIASASYLLDTGIPDGSGGAPTLLSATQWVAAEFAATGGETITSLSAYLTAAAGTTRVNDTFTFDIYSASGFTGRSRALLQSFTGTYTSDGWSTTSVDWTVPADGQYWLALQVGGTTQATKGIDLWTESSARTGTAAALAFALLNGNTNKQFTTSGALPFGVEVTVAPVPLPAGFGLLASGLLGFGALIGLQRGRRHGQSYQDHCQAAMTTGIHAAM